MDSFRTLITAADIRSRIGELSRQLASRFQGTPPCTVAVMEGARTFADHLCRHLPWSPRVHEIRAKSYGDRVESSGTVQVVASQAIPVAGRQVLLLEDIVDTGRTVAALRRHFMDLGATEVIVASLLSKPSRRVVQVDVELIGFEIPNEFVIGFGMDLAGRYRELDRVAIYEEARAQA